MSRTAPAPSPTAFGGAAGQGTIYTSNGLWTPGTPSAGTFATVDGRKAMHFDGATWARMPTATGAAEYSVSAWVKLEVSNQFATIVKNWDDTGTGLVGALQLCLGYNSPYQWSTAVGNTDGNYFAIEAGTAASTNVWYNVASTYSDVSKELKLYVDGTLISTTSANGTINNSIPWMSFGVKLNDSDGFNSPAVAFEGWLTGYLSDVTFWNVALTQGQVSSVFAGNPIPVPEPSTYALAGLSAIALAVVARQRRRNDLKPAV